MAEVERSLERYDVLERIAVGGMAEVFLAKAYGAHGFEKTLAIKRILPELARDPEFEERFIAEAKVAVRLSHANIVQVLDFGRFAGSLFIAMEFIDGLDLSAVLRRNKDHDRLIPMPAAFQIAIEIARGLDFAHQHGVVHRDVSPSNILLSRAGEVKIGDFGIAVAARPGGPGGQVRKVMGKWRYMSPEQTRAEQVDTKSDLFSAASVMFELFTGDKLFPGDEAEDIIKNIHDMPLPKLSQMRPGLPPRLDDILHAALSRDPRERPARAAIIQRQLTELSYESSIVATAMDVAETVNTAIDLKAPAGRASLDDIIRKQIAGALGGIQVGERSTAVSEPSRHTAQATDPDGSGLLAKIEETGRATLVHLVGEDGVTRLVDDTTIAAAPKALGRTTGPVPALGDGSTPRRRSGAMAAPEGDRERVARFELLDIDPEQERRRSRRLGLIALGVIAAGGAGFGVWWSGRGGHAASVEPSALADAGTAPVTRDAPLTLESVPPGAQVTVDGHPAGKTPVTVRVALGTHSIRLERAGYQPYTDDKVVVDAAIGLRVRAPLNRARAHLHADSTPPGATVLLRGRAIGETPLDLDDLEPIGKAELVFTLAGYQRATARVELRAGVGATAAVTLKAIPKVGTIKIAVDPYPSWAYVYLENGKKIGKAPSPEIHLPVGHHRLRLVNPITHKKTFLDVDVDADQIRLFRAHL
jgi:tRNA A-37 threonylcarbamoyl transferase component Bud32